MNAKRDTDGRSTLLSALFGLVAVLLVAAIGFATWIAIAYWGRIGV